MSSNHKKQKGSKICPDCGFWMELVEISTTRDGIIYTKKQYECLDCGFVGVRKNKKDNKIPLRDWGIE